jgi:HlyD family secretion protein
VARLRQAAAVEERAAIESPAPADEHAPIYRMDRRVAVAPRWRQRLGVAALGSLVLAAAATVYVRFGLTRTIVVNADHVVVARVAPGVFSEYVPSTANVEPRVTAYVDAVEGGQVAERLVEEGAIVTKGQPLVRLKNTSLQLEVLGRQAQLMEQLDRLNSTLLSFQQARLGHERELNDAQAEVEQTAQRLRRREALRPSGAVSQAEIDELAIDLNRYRKLQATMTAALDVDDRFQTQEVKQLKAAIRTTQDNLTLAGETLQSLTLRAPISGQLTAIDAELGAAKAPGQRIGQIDDERSYKAEAAIDEFYLGRVTVGQHAVAEVGGRDYPLEVAKVYPQVRERQFKVDLYFGEPAPPALRRGQTLEVRLTIGAARRGLVTANGPFYEDTGGSWAFVLSPSGDEAQRREVRFGRRNPEQIEVLSGLRPGERIITSSYQTLKSFDRVTIRGGS